MSSRPETGPVTLPANPKRVADEKVADLSSLGNLHKPPTPREYEHASLDATLTQAPDADVFAVLAHLETPALATLAGAAHRLESAVDRVLEARLGPDRG